MDKVVEKDDQSVVSIWFRGIKTFWDIWKLGVIQKIF